MFVCPNFLKNGFVITVLTVALTVVSSTVLAEEMSMEDFRAKFQETTGKSWEAADSAQKRNFVREYHKIFTETLKKTKLTTPAEKEGTPTAGDESSNLKREATVKVRKEFLKKNEKDWDDATAEEQEAFLKEYKIKMQEEMQLEQQKAMEDHARQQEKEYQKQMEIWNAQQEKQNEEVKRLEEERLQQEKKQTEKQKLEETFQKFEETRQKIREKRMQ